MRSLALCYRQSSFMQFACATLIEDPASLVHAQLCNWQPTYKELVRRSNGSAPTYGSVHLFVTLDAVRIHGCGLRGAATTAGIGPPTKIRICTSADGALP